MLYQALPPLESARLDRWERWLAPGLAVAAGLTLAVLLLLIGQPLLALVAALAGAGAGAFLYLRGPSAPTELEPLVITPDYALIGSALGLSRDPAALTSDAGSLLIVNPAYRDRFGANRAPLTLGADEDALAGLELAKSMASRDGAGCVAGIATDTGATPVEVERVGVHGDMLLWRFPGPGSPDPLDVIKWKEMYDKLEGTTDSCMGVAQALQSLSLKHG